MSLRERISRVWKKIPITDYSDQAGGVDQLNQDFDELTSRRVTREKRMGTKLPTGVQAYEREVGIGGVKKIVALGRVNEKGETNPNDTMIIRPIKEEDE